MSLIDPSTRWWNRYGVRRTAAWVCWTAAVVLALIGGWAVTGALGDAGASAAWVVPVVYTLGLLLLLGGTFLWLFGREIEHFEPRPMLMPIVALLGAQGSARSRTPSSRASIRRSSPSSSPPSASSGWWRSS